MKASHSQLSLCLILLSISANSLLCAAQDVVDIDGNPVQAGVDYYILPVIRGRGGGLTLASTGNKTCPLDVVQEPGELDNGLPLTFRPPNSSQRVVRVSADQNFIFSAASVCVQSTVWTLQLDESISNYIITTGGVEGNYGRETLSNWFRIDEYDSDYKIVYCPAACDTCRVICGDVDVLVQDGVRRLVLNGDAPLKVMFKKA
ncbi:kunitz trypsin inhibitor 5-like [Salvia miltiorrhiza]|uniref:kunitz trypsin inhibitor 5-like n=1 Tax=Salvia miltiorrhiza TaxID=226208 RepID=UPI0025AC6FF3|nr:kunitz trypsin inhibitor 5-like [Salvia miltiorrhiza]